MRKREKDALVPGLNNRGDSDACHPPRSCYQLGLYEFAGNPNDIWLEWKGIC